MLTLLGLIAYSQNKRFNSDHRLYIFLAIVMALEEKFRSAVRVIQTLPKDGPYQPSNSTKLKFYGLFKQASEGKCSQGRPSVFNIIGRAKYDAWNKLGDMDKDEAMTEYVEELKKIVETMSFSGDVQEFIDSIGPFYEFVNLQGAEMNHIKEAIDNWTSSSSSISSSTVSSTNNSPMKVNNDNEHGTVNIFDNDNTLPQDQPLNGTSPPVIKKSNGYLANRVSMPTSSSFTAPPAPVHRPSVSTLKRSVGLNNGNCCSENENNLDEVLEIDEVNHEYQINHTKGKTSVDSIQSGAESDKYYSGDSDPDGDIENRFSTSLGNMASQIELNSPHPPLDRSSGHEKGSVRNNMRQKVDPYQEEGSTQLFSGIGINSCLDTNQSTEFILHNTVERLNRDVDHILARLRILEAAYATNGQMSVASLGSQLRQKRIFGELSLRSLTVIFTWPFIAYFIIKLLKWWFMRRNRVTYR